ncbi:unnamed protein product [Penicillium nalgiovense]|nr:unnamed protein product [Penicillium nalgiovense]
MTSLICDIYKGNLDHDPYSMALIWCAMNGAIKGMHHLLFWKADLNTHLSLYKEHNGGITKLQTTSALHLAVEDDNLTMANLLLRHGADANAEFTDGITPLDVAVGRGNGVMTLLLLQNGAKIRDEITLSRAIEHAGTVAWVEAIRHGEYYPFGEPEVAPNYDFRAVVEVLHLYGADLNRYLLHDAVEHYGSPDDGVIELLLYLGADVHAKDKGGDRSYLVLSRAHTAMSDDLKLLHNCL